MIAENDLLEAIAQCETEPIRYSNIEKLANLYTVHGHLYGKEQPVQRVTEEVVGRHGDSEFLEFVSGRSAKAVWCVVGELLDVLQVTNPRLYDGVMRKIESL